MTQLVSCVDASPLLSAAFSSHDTSPATISTLSLTTLFRSNGFHFARDFFSPAGVRRFIAVSAGGATHARSEEHTSELQSRFDLVCRLLLDNKNGSRSSLPTQHHKALCPQPLSISLFSPTRS